MIELELTEHALIENDGELYRKLRILQEQGFRFAMDGFGSGYSLLNMLKNAMVDTIKLGREFLNESTATTRGKIMVQSTIVMARQFNVPAL